MIPLIPFMIIAAVTALDQISKHIILATMQIGESFNFINYILNITFTTNTGASFGILKNHRWVFMSLSTVALILMTAAIVYLMHKKSKDNMFIAVALAFMLGGGFGNMIDRVAKGYVVDFLEFAFVDFAIFNLADTFICIGSVLFCICIFAGKYSIFDTTDTTDTTDVTDKTDTPDTTIETDNITDMEN